MELPLSPTVPIRKSSSVQLSRVIRPIFRPRTLPGYWHTVIYDICICFFNDNTTLGGGKSFRMIAFNGNITVRCSGNPSETSGGPVAYWARLLQYPPRGPSTDIGFPHSHNLDGSDLNEFPSPPSAPCGTALSRDSVANFDFEYRKMFLKPTILF